MPFLQRSFWIQAGLVLTGLFFLALASAVVTWKTHLADIQAIYAEGNDIVSAEDIVANARVNAEAPILGPLPGNLFIFPKERIRASLFKNYPRLKEITVHRNFLKRTVRIQVSERQQFGIYCSLPFTAPIETIKKCFLFDDQGFLFAEAPQTQGGLILSITDRTEAPADIGVSVLSPDRISAINDLWQTVRTDVRVPVGGITRSEGDTLEVETLEGWRALFDLNQDVRKQTLALRELLSKELPAKKRIGISVIDLRVPGKIFYQ